MIGAYVLEDKHNKVLNFCGIYHALDSKTKGLEHSALINEITNI